MNYVVIQTGIRTYGCYKAFAKKQRMKLQQKEGKRMKKIDVHIHSSMWNGAKLHSGCILVQPEEIKESYTELGIDKGFLLPLISPEAHYCIQTNEEMEYLANKYSDTFYWFCNIDPRMGQNSPATDFSELLLDYKSRGAIGVGELTANIYADAPLMDNLFYHCAQCDMPVTIHFACGKGEEYGIIDDLGLPRLEKMLKKYPNLTIMGHSQCFWNEIGDNVTEENRGDYVTGKVNAGRVVELMRHYPNLYCDLSAGSGYNAMSRDSDFSYRFIEEFSDRLMFGTDICRAHQETYLSDWLDASLEKGCISEENYRKICRENAIRLFKLKDEI